MSTWASSLLGPDVFFSQTFVFLLFCFLLIFFFSFSRGVGPDISPRSTDFFFHLFLLFLICKIVVVVVLFLLPSFFFKTFVFFHPLQFEFVVVLCFAIEHSIIMYWIVELPRCVTTPHLVFFLFLDSYILCVCPFIVNQVGIESRDAHRRFLSFCGESFLIVSDDEKQQQQQQNNTYWNSFLHFFTYLCIISSVLSTLFLYFKNTFSACSSSVHTHSIILPPFWW